MKRYKFILFFVPLFLLGSCNYLDFNEAQVHTVSGTFHNSSPRGKQFLNSIYNMLPDGFDNVGGSMRASASDDALENNSYAVIQKMVDGRWSANATVDGQWGSLYAGIRAANIFLKNFSLDYLNDRKYDDNYQQLVEQYRLYQYEARFLRAFFYFRLIKRYDNVPLVTKVLTPEEANQVKPSSYQKVTQFIVSECDTIIPFLPVSYASIPNEETGRATRGAAMALKAKVLLYAASPLHNPSGDVEKWVEAARAAKAIIDAGWYQLAADYSAVFNNLNSKELIFGGRQGNSNSFERNNFPAGVAAGNINGTDPTQNLVDAYRMQKTGLPITDQNSGYDQQHPYVGRDPRLLETVIVNNSVWKGRTVELWDGGFNGPPLSTASKTGYYLKKLVVEGVRLGPPKVTTARHVWPIFRYGGILLDYAEAMNEAYGPDDPADLSMTARQAADEIRERSHMPDFPTGLTKAAFRKMVHNERRVEMAFENQRFWDIRRWKIGPSTTDIKGMEITKNQDGTFTYQVRTIEQRAWDNKMYYYPIPQGELFKNKNLKQTPGW